MLRVRVSPPAFGQCSPMVEAPTLRIGPYGFESHHWHVCSCSPMAELPEVRPVRGYCKQLSSAKSMAMIYVLPEVRPVRGYCKLWM